MDARANTGSQKKLASQGGIPSTACYSVKAAFPVGLDKVGELPGL